MRRLWLAGAAVALLGACAGPGSDMRNRPLAPNPSGFVAAELAFARLAQDKGQWTAFRETSAPDAVMFVPERVNAKAWLKGRADPPASVRWQPHAVFSSCDGSAGATTGAWQQPDGSTGYYTTVWLRDPLKGELRWVLDHGDGLASPREAPEFIASKQAACGARPAVGIAAGGEGDDTTVGLSRDQTMSWASTVRPDKSRRVTIRLWDGEAMVPVVDDVVAAPGAAA